MYNMRAFGLFAIRRKKKALLFALVCCSLLVILKYLHSSRGLNLVAPLQLLICEKTPTVWHGVKIVTQASRTTKPSLPPYVPVGFKLILPYIEPKLDKEESNLFMAVTVNSAASAEKNRKLREAIRKTWGNWRKPWNSTFAWRLFFVLGVSENKITHKENLIEAQEHNDIIIGNITDNYRNVVVKTFMGLFYSTTKLSCKYVLKTDDDVYIRVPGLINWLVDSGNPKSFYGGFISKFKEVPRNPKSKWYISYEQYGEPNWPPWCHGSYTVFSYDVIPYYLTYTFRNTPYHTDDAYIGVASKFWGINATHIPGFTIEHEEPERKRSDEELRGALTIGHKVEPEVMLNYYEFYEKNNLE